MVSHNDIDFVYGAGWIVLVDVDGETRDVLGKAAEQTEEAQQADVISWLARLIERERAEVYAAGKADGAAEERARHGCDLRQYPWDT